MSSIWDISIEEENMFFVGMIVGACFGFVILGLVTAGREKR